MGAIQVSVNVGRNGLADKLARWDDIVAKGEMVCDRVANQSLARLVNATPTRYYGKAKGSWFHAKIAPMVHVNTNPSKVMRFLEDGTKAHGPKTAKALFIPLNQQTSEAGPRGVMEANAAARTRGVWTSYNARVMGNRSAPKLPYVFGVDFVWARRVRGIKARHIARDEQKVVRRELRDQLVTMLERELS